MRNHKRMTGQPSVTTVAVQSDERGFTLIEVVIAVAIVAILAGAVVPMAFRQIVKAKEEATAIELNTISDGLVEFYEDTGRFPSEGEGLVALVSDPGVTGWQGPYVGGNSSMPALEIASDEFGEAYAYDVDPTLNPITAADVVVVSGGSDFTLSSGSVNHTWAVGAPGDDLIILVSASPITREKIQATADEIEAIAAAARIYFEHNAAFPTLLSQLSGSYLDPGIDTDAFTDPWYNTYVLVVTTPPGSAPWLSVRSFGPDQQDDGGADDDIWSTISGVPPGRSTTTRKLEIIQASLNNNPALVLTGNWLSDRSSLGLISAYDRDGWDQTFSVNIASRTIFSIGPDGSGISSNDNIPTGVGP